MEEMSGNFDFDSLDPLDFGEPTAETQQDMREALDKIKTISSVEVRQPKDIIRSLSTSAFMAINLDSLCPITKYTYTQMADARYAMRDDNYLQCVQFEVDPTYRESWRKILGNYVTCKIYFQNPNIEINYEKSEDTEILYLSDPLPSGMNMQSPEFQLAMQKRAVNLMTALSNGSALSTDGSMRKFLVELKQDLATRV